MKNEMKIIFDIGANLGDFTQECLNRYPDTTVIAVEANDELVEKLKERFLNKNVIILNSLVSSKSGEELDFFISSAHTISTASKNWVKNSRFANTYEWNRLVKKRSITIDDLINAYGNPDLIKIDVEGYEFEALEGALETITKNKPIIILEIWPSNKDKYFDWFKLNLPDYDIETLNGWDFLLKPKN